MAEKSVSTDSLAMEPRREYNGKKLRIAFIGCGGIAQTHLGALKDYPRRRGRRRRRYRSGPPQGHGREMGRRRSSTTTGRRCSRRSSPTPSASARPTASTPQPAIDAANAGCHVIVEKPMAMNARRMPEDDRRGRRRPARSWRVGFQYRYHPDTRVPRPRPRRRHVRQHHVRQVPGPAPPRHSQLGRLRPEGTSGRRPDDRHRRARHRDGPLRHGLPQARRRHAATPGPTWATSPATSPACGPNWDYKTYTVEDLAIGQIRFENGAILQIEAMLRRPHREGRLELHPHGRQRRRQAGTRPTIFTDRAGTMINETPGVTCRDKTDFPTCSPASCGTSSTAV